MKSYKYKYNENTCDFYQFNKIEITNRIFAIYFPIYTLIDGFKLTDETAVKKQAETHKKFDTLIKKLK